MYSMSPCSLSAHSRLAFHFARSVAVLLISATARTARSACQGRQGPEASVGPRFLMSRAPSGRRSEDVDETAKASDARVHSSVLCPSQCGIGRARARAARAALRMGPFPAAILRRRCEEVIPARAPCFDSLSTLVAR
jgi:hypothetical protein